MAFFLPLIFLAIGGGTAVTAGGAVGVYKFVNRTSLDDLLIADKEVSVTDAVEKYEKIFKKAVKKDKIT